MIREHVSLRRGLTATVAALSILVGLFAVRVAADWTASASPLNDTPPSIESLRAALTAEQERSTALQAQLEQVTTRTGGLTQALPAADDRLRSDTAHARRLERRLSAAKTRLARLERSLRTRQAIQQARTVVSYTARTPPTPSPSGENGEHEGEPDDD